MSKKCKAQGSEKRLKEKRNRKAVMQAQYQKFKEQGKNTKSKRSKRKASKAKSGITNINHPNGRCGNPGCIKCFGINFNPFLYKGKPLGMPCWMYLKWEGQRS